MSVVTARPISERIVDVVYQRLRVLLAGSSPYFRASEVVRFNAKDTFSPRDSLVLLVQSSHVRLPELDHAGNPPAICWRLTLAIRCFVKPSELDSTPVDELVNVAGAEVMKVITDGSATWHTIDGLAINADFGDWELIADDGSGLDGVTVPLVIDYRVSELDPYTSRV